MLWYKSWLETRWRFLIGLGLLLLSAGGIVYVYPQVVKLRRGPANWTPPARLGSASGKA